MQRYRRLALVDRKERVNEYTGVLGARVRVGAHDIVYAVDVSVQATALRSSRLVSLVTGIFPTPRKS